MKPLEKMHAIRRHLGVGLLTLLDLSALPLADAGAAGICQHSAADLGEDIDEAITLNGGADLLTARGDGEGHLPPACIKFSIHCKSDRPEDGDS